jgi:uncharacterized lipoprotein YmbA
MRPSPTPDRRIHRASLPLALVAVVLALGGCTSLPPTHYHSLMPAEVQTRGGAASRPAMGLAIVLEPVRVPAQVDQPQWVVRLPDDSIAVLEQERWASALPDEFRAALLEELIVGHGTIEARTQPQPAVPPWRIAIDLRRFDSLPAREARIEGSWLIQGSGAARAAASRCEWLVREPATGSMPALAAAHRRAIARLADAMALALARAARGETPACPALDERR